jgi:hypothetical protein
MADSLPRSFMLRTVSLTFVLSLVSLSALAQDAMDLKTRKGVSVVMVNMLSSKPDCSLGAVALPTLLEKPRNGVIQMQLAFSDVAALGNCPARKVPSIAVIYTPKPDFVGADWTKIDFEVGGKTTTVSYRFSVGADEP